MTDKFDPPPQPGVTRDNPLFPKGNHLQPRSGQLDPSTSGNEGSPTLIEERVEIGRIPTRLPGMYSSMPEDRYFYSLPEEVWNEIQREIPESLFEPGNWTREIEVAQMCGEHVQCVGVQGGKVILYGYVRSRLLPISFSKEEAEHMGMSHAAANLAASKANKAKASSSLRARHGYLGWLMTNRLFIEEHDQLIQSNLGLVREHGLQFVQVTHPPEDAIKDESEQVGRFVDELNQFLLRWRISGLAGPYLPIPLPILLGGKIPASLLDPLRQAGGLVFIPDTIPLPARDELREYLTAASRPADEDSESQHIKEWRTIIRNDNSARTQIGRYARVFELQHYWRLLHTRHPQACHRRGSKLHEALARFFEVSTNSIRSDLTLVKKGLGKGWETRQSPLEVNPLKQGESGEK